MFIGLVGKQPGERKDRDANFVDYLADRPGDFIKSAVVTVDDPSLTVELGDIVGPRVKVWFAGGTHGVTYKVTVVVTTDMGRIVEAEIRVRVREV